MTIIAAAKQKCDEKPDAVPDQRDNAENDEDRYESGHAQMPRWIRLPATIHLRELFERGQRQCLKVGLTMPGLTQRPLAGFTAGGASEVRSPGFSRSSCRLGEGFPTLWRSRVCRALPAEAWAPYDDESAQGAGRVAGRAASLRLLEAVVRQGECTRRQNTPDIRESNQ